MHFYKKLPGTLRLLILVLFLLPTLLFFLVSSVLLIYAFVPVPLAPEKIISARKTTIIAHGLGDTPQSWSKNLAEIINKSGSGYTATALDWSEYANSIFRCSVNGLRLGKKIGRELAGDKNLQAVHLIGHSCGAFVVRGICLGIKEERKDITVQTTFLDPVSNYGGVVKSFGTEVFGSCGDKSEAYIDTGDSVPGSNQPLSYGVTYDVTPIRGQSSYSGNPHLWPVVHYTDLVKSGRAPFPRTKLSLKRFAPIRPCWQLRKILGGTASSTLTSRSGEGVITGSLSVPGDRFSFGKLPKKTGSTLVDV